MKIPNSEMENGMAQVNDLVMIHSVVFVRDIVSDWPLTLGAEMSLCRMIWGLIPK